MKTYLTLLACSLAMLPACAASAQVGDTTPPAVPAPAQTQLMPEYAYVAAVRTEHKSYGGSSLENDPIIMVESHYYRKADAAVNVAELFKGVDLAKDGVAIAEKEKKMHYTRAHHPLVTFVLKDAERYYVVHMYSDGQVFRVMESRMNDKGELDPMGPAHLRDVKLPALYERLKHLLKAAK